MTSGYRLSFGFSSLIFSIDTDHDEERASRLRHSSQCYPNRIWRDTPTTAISRYQWWRVSVPRVDGKEFIVDQSV